MITLYLSLVFLYANAIQVNVEGDITIDLSIGNGEGKGGEIASGSETQVKTKDEKGGREMKANNRKDDSSDDSEELAKKRRERVKKNRLVMVTKAAALECVYQYPETSQAEAILSNMMNQLAKVYVRVQDYVSGDARRGSGRFQVVNTKNHTFFDEIYTNMTQEYRKLYNTTAWWVPRTNDPCDVQPELKTVWSHLIDSSIHYLRSAVVRSVHNFMQNKIVSTRKRSAVHRLVEKELSRVRTSQLDTLCDNFQLCFDELASQNNTDNEKYTLKANTLQPYYKH